MKHKHRGEINWIRSHYGAAAAAAYTHELVMDYIHDRHKVSDSDEESGSESDGMPIYMGGRKKVLNADATLFPINKRAEYENISIGHQSDIERTGEHHGEGHAKFKLHKLFQKYEARKARALEAAGVEIGAAAAAAHLTAEELAGMTNAQKIEAGLSGGSRKSRRRSTRRRSTRRRF